MSADETRQMSAAETGQMSAVETRQMSTIAICFVSTHNVEVSEVATIPMSLLKSQKSQLSNITMLKSQIGGLTLNRRKWLEVGPE